jgi:pyruvate kinase
MPTRKKREPQAAGDELWDREVCLSLIQELWQVRAAMLDSQKQIAPALAGLEPARVPSAVNLAHYLALRRFDLRRIQERLAWIGVSSLGRAETHVLANLDKVLGLLHRLAGRRWKAHSGDEPVGSVRGPATLERNAAALFGTAPSNRSVRIMVTLPTEAATDPALAAGLVAAGMDVARINCAHDDAPAWIAMAEKVRAAGRAAGRPVRVLMDLAGPKLRTGPFEQEAAAFKLRPQRDAMGRVVAPARLGLRAAGSQAAFAEAAGMMEVDAGWLAQVRSGSRVRLTDARGADRLLNASRRRNGAVLFECEHTLYLTEGMALHLLRGGDKGPAAELSAVPVPEARILLQAGQKLRLVGSGAGRAARPAGRRAHPAVVVCTLPEALRQIRPGERIWFDDGHIGGRIGRVTSKWADVTVTDAAEGGTRLAADKGINLPDSRLDLPALTDKDIEDLAVAAAHADLVGLSFAQSARDVHELRDRLEALHAGHLGLILKIETRRGFENLPQLLFAAMGGSAAGVMIARGDLAVECGFERLAEVQEEILWACEAAHLPVVWATQVLESLAKTGQPSRAEVTDAAMGERAECVMLNKGPHVVKAVHALDDILRRMQTHQSKKRPLLRALKSWMPGGGRASQRRDRRH